VHTFWHTPHRGLLRHPVPRRGSWEAEQAAQIDQLIAFVNQKAGNDGKVLVLGDMNTGTRGQELTRRGGSQLRQVRRGRVYRRVHQDGKRAVYILQHHPLVGEGTPSVVIDHVFTRNLTGSASRVLEGTVNVSVTTPACGGTPEKTETVTTAYSDHYGLQATLK